MCNAQFLKVPSRRSTFQGVAHSAENARVSARGQILLSSRRTILGPGVEVDRTAGEGPLRRQALARGFPSPDALDRLLLDVVWRLREGAWRGVTPRRDHPGDCGVDAEASRCARRAGTAKSSVAETCVTPAGPCPLIVAHSFGIYILGNALLKYDWFWFNERRHGRNSEHDRARG